jgi:curli biogenesis system outer membrane secretion channel CsgG
MKKYTKLIHFGQWLLLCAPLSLLIGCATVSQRAITPTTSTAAASAAIYSGPRHAIVLGRFDNRSSFARGIFSDGVDTLGTQARGILETHLQQTGRFQVLDRTNLAETAREAELLGVEQRLAGARATITGEVAEFGRKEVGDRQLFGIMGSGKTQVAYAKVNLRVVDVVTGDVLFAVQGAGEYALSNREVLGFGGTAGYDSTLTGKVLDLAIRECIDRLVEGLQNNSWKL